MPRQEFVMRRWQSPRRLPQAVPEASDPAEPSAAPHEHVNNEPAAHRARLW